MIYKASQRTYSEKFRKKCDRAKNSLELTAAEKNKVEKWTVLEEAAKQLSIPFARSRDTIQSELQAKSTLFRNYVKLESAVKVLMTTLNTLGNDFRAN